MSPQRFLGEFEQMVLLAILQCGSAAFAMEIRLELEERAGRTVSRGAFYRTLDRLERKRLIRWSEATPVGDRSGSPIRRYQVTAYGIEALRVSREALQNLWRGLDGVLRKR